MPKTNYDELFAKEKEKSDDELKYEADLRARWNAKMESDYKDYPEGLLLDDDVKFRIVYYNDKPYRNFYIKGDDGSYKKCDTMPKIARHLGLEPSDNHGAPPAKKKPKRTKAIEPTKTPSPFAAASLEEWPKDEDVMVRKKVPVQIAGDVGGELDSQIKKLQQAMLEYTNSDLVKIKQAIEGVMATIPCA